MLALSSLLAILCVSGTLSTTFYTQSFFRESSSIIARSIDMPLDHFNASDTRTFKNHYWINDAFYQGGPVFFFDHGEVGVTDNGNASLEEGPQHSLALIELAKKYQGIVILWEHRFYGASMPFEIDNATGLALEGYEAYKYLTNEQALEDAVFFATHFELSGYGGDLTSNSTPWIWVGGSYAGERAAMIRQRNPNVFFASWASSAPVESVAYSSVYWNVIQQTMPGNCSADVQAAVSYADQILRSGSAAEVSLLGRAIYLMNDANPAGSMMYSNASSDDLSYWDLGEMLAYPFLGSFVNFQYFGYQLSLGRLCDTLEKWNPSNFTFTMDSSSSILINNTEDSPTSSAGVAATHGHEAAFYAYLHAVIQKSISDEESRPVGSWSSIVSVSWLWQICSQYGISQLSNPSSSMNLISSFINASSATDDCLRMFPYAPSAPDIEAFNKYGGWAMQPSNVMFTDGALDPWGSLSVQATTDINPQALNRPTTSEVPKCNTPPSGNTVFGLVYPDTVHGKDLTQLRDVKRPSDQGLALFEEALDAWLPCFQAS